MPLFESQDLRVEEKKLKEIVEDDKDSDSEEDLEGYEDKDARYKYLRSFSFESNSAIVNSNAIGKGKIMTNEEDENVAVKSSTYWRLFKPAGGWCPLIFINLSMICFMFTSIASNFFLQQWAYSSPED